MTMPQPRAGFSFQAFLSHRYKSPEVNLYFYNLFSEAAEVQFEVDEGLLSTNVTRLERMVRAADAFIGLYPVPHDAGSNPSPAELLKASRYFRLELELAIRSGRPALVYYDVRYGNIFACPRYIQTCPFKHDEVGGGGGFPSAAQHRESFRRFLDVVAGRMSYKALCTPSPKTRIVVILPEGEGEYGDAHRSAVRRLLRENLTSTVTVVDWPPVLGGELLSYLEEADWVVVDIGAASTATGLPAYLHGQFIPLVRLRRVPPGAEPAPTPLETTLLGGVDVGYRTDILQWEDEEALVIGLQKRLASLTASVRRISTQADAVEYFSAAAKRKEAVFLSYSGQDRTAAEVLDAPLKSRFLQVFNYRDGTSLDGGKPWLSGMLDSLAKSAVGIPLLSAGYLKSRYCQQEAELMIKYRNDGKMIVIPIKLEPEAFDLPPYLEGLQYLRRWEYPTSEALMSRIEQLIAVELAAPKESARAP